MLGTEAVLVMERSADAVMGTFRVNVLLAGTGSASMALTEAVFASVPVAAGLRLRTSVTVAVAPLPRVPSAQLTVTVHVPWLGVAETNVAATGSGSVKV